MNKLFRSHLVLQPWMLALVTLGLLLAEVAMLSQRVDAYSLVMRGFDGWQVWFGYLGHAAKWAVVMVVSLLLLLSPVRRQWAERLAGCFSLKRSVIWLLFQLASFAVLWLVNDRVFGPDSKPTTIDFMVWLCAASLVVMVTAMAVMPLHLWRAFIREHYLQLALSMVVATVMLALAFGSGRLWGPMASGTFQLAEFWLGLLPLPDLYVSEAERTLGIGGFYVHVADACSGYEGIGLVSAFTGLVLYLYRQVLRFPEAWLLLPLGMVVIWLLNSVRIAALIIIGALWSPEVAVGGFHSQAGWLMFVATSLILLWLALQSRFFVKPHDQQAETTPLPRTAESGQDGFAVLIPVVALLASTLIIGVFSAGFDYAYPIKVVTVAVALAWVWSKLGWQVKLPRGPIAYVAGVVVAVIWVLLLGATNERNSDFQLALDAMPPEVAFLWLAVRVIGAVVTVPIAEELAFRGYLLARLAKSENYTAGPLPRVWLALVVSSLAFGAMHGAWLAGAVAGGIYGYVRWCSPSINEAIWAHSITNGLLCIFAIATGAWHLL